MRICFDMCSIQRPLDEQSQIRVRLEAEAVLSLFALSESGEVDLLASDALRFETRRNPNPVRRRYAEAVLATAADFVTASESVESRAREYTASGIKPLDALHLACAVAGSANYFCTTDDRLLRRGKGVDTGKTKVVSPLELIEEIER